VGPGVCLKVVEKKKKSDPSLEPNKEASVFHPQPSQRLVTLKVQLIWCQQKEIFLANI
jgi:hypothetical protein